MKKDTTLRLDDLSINGKFIEITDDKKTAIPEFYKLRCLESDIDGLIEDVRDVVIKYGDEDNLVVDNPITEDWYKRIIDRLLLQAVREDMDAISIVQ